MHLYSGSTTDFLTDVETGRIATVLNDRFFEEYRFAPVESEVRSWQNSLGSMATVVDRAGLRDHGVLVEYQLPLTSRRLDCMFTQATRSGVRPRWSWS